MTPGFGRTVVDRCRTVGLPLVPGACTPTEVQMARDAGLGTVTFFPAEDSGGVSYLRALGRPFGDVGFVPTGGVDADNLAVYLGLPQVLACGGSWLVRRDLLARGDFATVERLAAEASAIVRGAR